MSTDETAAGGPMFQVVVDANDPHRVATFWAAALHYDVEDAHDQVVQMIELGHATRDDAVEIDGRLWWAAGVGCSDPGGVRPRLLFQQVPETKSVKNRVHLDIRIGVAGRAAEVARLEALGARRLWDGQQGPSSWTTMADPEGNEFCVT